ncbi:hypothetical protein [Nostoc sp. C110]|uniref:hypothetical protein n=1 Tax=Nostoc sp. C110 TaxID=3349876 RepID=UPI00370D2E09
MNPPFISVNEYLNRMNPPLNSVNLGFQPTSRTRSHPTKTYQLANAPIHKKNAHQL